MGTPDFSVPVLNALVAAGHKVVRVYTQPPRPAGRGKKLRPSPVHQSAEALGLEIATPDRFRGETVEAFAALEVEAAVVVAYGQILPQTALDAPRHGCLNLHASLLPRWRGAAPIQRAIMAGDAETGVCVMQMEASLDTGPVLMRRATAISETDTAASLHDRLAKISSELIVETLADLGSLEPEVQSDVGVTYAAKIDKAEARIDWTRKAVDLSAHIRGLSPFPGAWCEIGGERVKILMARAENASGEPGQALDDALLVGCGEQAIRLTRLQRAGKAAVEAQDFLRGLPVPGGTALG